MGPLVEGLKNDNVVLEDDNGTVLETKTDELTPLALVVGVLPNPLSLPVIGSPEEPLIEAVGPNKVVEFERGNGGVVCESPDDVLDAPPLPVVPELGVGSVPGLTEAPPGIVGFGDIVAFVKGNGGVEVDTPGGSVGSPVPKDELRALEGTLPVPTVLGIA